MQLPQDRAQLGLLCKPLPCLPYFWPVILICASWALSLLRQPFFSLLGLFGCSLCCLIPALLLNFSASWVLAFSHLSKQPQRLYKDNYSFHQLFIKLVSFACHSQFSKAPSLWWLTFSHAVWNVFLPCASCALVRGWARHCASCTLLLGQAGTTKSYCATPDRPWFILWDFNFGKSLGKKHEKLHAFVLQEAIELFTLGNREINFAACWRSRWVVYQVCQPSGILLWRRLPSKTNKNPRQTKKHQTLESSLQKVLEWGKSVAFNNSFANDPVIPRPLILVEVLQGASSQTDLV